MTAQTWTKEELALFIADRYGVDQFAQIWAQIGGWIQRGDGAAIYTNADLGSPNVGEPRIASYGSAQAQLEGDTPPQRLPDIGNVINWRFWLDATYRPSEHDSGATLTSLIGADKYTELSERDIKEAQETPPDDSDEDYEPDFWDDDDDEDEYDLEYEYEDE